MEYPGGKQLYACKQRMKAKRDSCGDFTRWHIFCVQSHDLNHWSALFWLPNFDGNNLKRDMECWIYTQLKSHSLSISKRVCKFNDKSSIDSYSILSMRDARWDLAHVLSDVFQTHSENFLEFSLLNKARILVKILIRNYKVFKMCLISRSGI